MGNASRLYGVFVLGVLFTAPVAAADVAGSFASLNAANVPHASLGKWDVARLPSVAADCDTTSDSCDSCCTTPCCCSPVSKHRCSVFADVLFLRPGNVDVVYAQEQTSFDPALASPTGPVGRTSIDGGAGFRIGANWALDDCASIVATYSWFESDTENDIAAAPGTVLNLDVGHPSLLTSGAGSRAATAVYNLDFQILDIDYRSLLCGSCDAAIDYTVGLRYAHLSQDFVASQDIFAGAGLTSVATQIDLDGVGIHLGLDGLKRRAGTGLLLYAKGDVSFVGGEFKANFTQTNQFGGAAVVRNELADYRVVTILESELGLGWESCGGRLRVTSGYAISGWLNTLTTGSYIDGVQDGSYTDLSETLTFDGLVTRLELRF